jgi:Protein of unknown function (DUF2950)/Protein of unknown function (DUF3300)
LLCQRGPHWRLRTKAQAQGTLKTTNEQKVIVEPPAARQTTPEQGVVVQQPVSSQTTVIRIEPANPQVVYVPTYNPTVVYGAWPYPAYPPYAYYPPGFVAATSVFSFGVGVAVGSALWGDCDWGRGDVDINVNRYNNFNKTNITSARGKGYVKGKGARGQPLPYHGYYYRILKEQGPDASGGAYGYIVRGKMLGGFALVAYPASWGNSGVMTFLVNHDGVVFQKDLGPNTAAQARAMTQFNPDNTWTRL